MRAGGTGNMPIRVLIVEDSDVVRLLLEAIINDDPRLEVAASVSSGEEALKMLQKIKPDVISLDIRLPGMSGFETTYRIMSEQPTPIVVVAASVTDEELNISMNALRAGALAVVEKPVGEHSEHYKQIADRVCNQLFRMSQVKVITQKSQPVLKLGSKITAVSPAKPAPDRMAVKKLEAFTRPDVIGIAASTGGPMALSKILTDFPPDFPIPILLVQHITPAFCEGFVAWMNNVSPLKVVTAADGAYMQPGHVYVAPPHKHLEARNGYMALVDGSMVNTQKPSGTVLFRSMALHHGRRAAGILLTGMGEDGALGLKDIKDNGGYTLIEDSSTAVVYGMPGAAASFQAQAEQLPLHKIAPRILQLAELPSTEKVCWEKG